MRTIWLFILAGMVISCAAVRFQGAGKQTRQILKGKIPGKNNVTYWLYLPEGYGPAGKEWPLMLFLHGAGERGDDLEKVKVHGPPKLIAEGEHFPFIVVSPQCPKDQWWDIASLDLLLKHVIAECHVDTVRLYLTGLSMGGFGTWAMAAAYPERFAAIVPICGGGDPEQADRLARVPAWVFHGAKDNVVPLARSQEMVDAVKKAGGKVKFTVYPEAGHDSWTETYENPALYRWLLKQRRQF